MVKTLACWDRMFNKESVIVEYNSYGIATHYKILGQDQLLHDIDIQTATAFMIDYIERN